MTSNFTRGVLWGFVSICNRRLCVTMFLLKKIVLIRVCQKIQRGVRVTMIFLEKIVCVCGKIQCRV